MRAVLPKSQIHKLSSMCGAVRDSDYVTYERAPALFEKSIGIISLYTKQYNKRNLMIGLKKEQNSKK